MADKFLNTGGSGGVNISNGTTDVFAATISAANLDPSRPIKTNAVRELVSSNLDIADVNNLQQELDNVITQPYNGTLKATDFETDNYFSVNDELQKIDNLTASTEAPDTTNITGLLNADEMATGRIYDEAQQTFIELDGTDVAVSATDLTLNGNSVLTVGGTTITDLETKTQNIDLTTTAGQTDITGVIKPDEILIDDIDGVGFSVDIANFEGMKVRDGIKSINYDDDAFMRITSSSNLFRFNWTSADVPANDGDWITYSQSGGTDGVLIISPPNFTNGELQLLGGNITIASDFFVVDCVMNATDFVKYQGGVDYLNPPGLNSLAAVGYVNQETAGITDLETKTQNIDLTTTTGQTDLTGDLVMTGNIDSEVIDTGGAVGNKYARVKSAGTIIMDGENQSLGPTLFLNWNKTGGITTNNTWGNLYWKGETDTGALGFNSRIYTRAENDFTNINSATSLRFAVSDLGTPFNQTPSDKLILNGNGTSELISPILQLKGVGGATQLNLQIDSLEEETKVFNGLKLEGTAESVGTIDINTSNDFLYDKWRTDYANTQGGTLSLQQSKISFNQTGYQKFIGNPSFLFNTSGFFRFRTTGTAVAGVQYFGIADNPIIDAGNPLVGFSGQDIAGTIYVDGVPSGGQNNQWITGDICEWRFLGGSWQIYKNGLPTGSSFSISNNGRPYYPCIINNFGGGNLCSYEITQVSTTYVPVEPFKQIGLSTSGAIEFDGNPVYVQDINKSLVYKDKETDIVYPIAGKEVRVVKKFNCAVDNVLYEDDFVRIDWIGLELQPSYVLKILPTGQGAFPDYVDTSITFVGGGASSVGNGDGANAINTKFYFNGSAILNAAFTHLNYGSTSRGFLIAENDLNYPSYTLKIATGDVAFLGVSVVERY